MQRSALPSLPTAVAAATVAAGAALTSGQRTAPRSGGARSQARAVQSIIDTALLSEHLATAFYYTALTTPAVLRHPQLGGRSGDPNNPGLPPGGNPHHVRYLQAALDAEASHAEMLATAGAASSVRRFYFPAGAFKRLGTSLQSDSFLGVLEQLETLSIGLYLAMVGQLSQSQRNHLDLVQLAAEIAGVEAEHRMLGRVIAGLKPANNLTLEKEPYTTVSQASAALHPFLSGKGFGGGAARPVALPSRAQVARVVGKYGTRRVSHFL